jgi:hypothetical protein
MKNEIKPGMVIQTRVLEYKWQVLAVHEGTLWLYNDRRGAYKMITEEIVKKLEWTWK